MDKPLTSRQENFARAVVEGCSNVEAYRRSYSPKRMTEKTLGEEASRTAALPGVAARIRELQDRAAAASVVDASWVLGQWVAIASADPNEVINHQHNNCRHCRGLGHAYQWRDEAEWAEAVAKAIAQNLALPTADGGYGFNPTLDPVPDCPHCFGEGVGRVFLADTRRLVGNARRLYAGIKQTRHGIEVKLRDQDEALLNIAKYLGMLDLKVKGELNLNHQAALSDEQRALLRSVFKDV